MRVCALLIIIAAICTMFRSHTNKVGTHWKSKNYTSPDLRLLAVLKVVDDHKTVKQAARECKIPDESVRTYLRRYNETGSVLTMHEHEKRRNSRYIIPYKRKIDAFCGALIVGLVAEYQFTLDEIVVEVEKAGYDVSRAAINDYIIRQKYTYKVISKVARETDPNDVHRFWYEFYSICTDYKQLVFLDETWRDDRTANKTRGRSLRGERCEMTINMTRGKYKINLLLAVNHNGPLCWDMYSHSIDDQAMEVFLWNQLMYNVQPYPGSNSIIILDNHYTHECDAIFRFARMLGVYILYEPAHVPPYNLTEWTFNAIKQKEKAKGIFGSLDSAVASLQESIEDCIGLNWKKVMKQIGYVDTVTDSD